MNWAYLVRCADGSLYAGWTVNLPARLKAHNSGRGAKYTRGRRPVHLVWARQYATKSQAMRAEAWLKQLPKTQKEGLAALHSVPDFCDETVPGAP